jgi:TonB family protein
VFSPNPDYSKEARDAHYEGTCVLWLWIGTDGKPHSVRVARGHGLDEKAVEAVKKWKFEPAMMNGEPVAVQINVEVSFRLSAVAVSPTSAQVITGSQQQFSAIVFTLSEPTKSAVNWSLSGPGCVASACGNISPDGLYTGASVFRIHVS